MSYQQRARWRVVAKRWEDGCIVFGLAAVFTAIFAFGSHTAAVSSLALGAASAFCLFMRGVYTRWAF